MTELTERQWTFSDCHRLVLWRMGDIQSLLDSALHNLDSDHPAHAIIVNMRTEARNVADVIDAGYAECGLR